LNWTALGYVAQLHANYPEQDLQDVELVDEVVVYLH
jgi:hypothetical protein